MIKLLSIGNVRADEGVIVVLRTSSETLAAERIGMVTYINNINPIGEDNQTSVVTLFSFSNHHWVAECLSG